jgi:hypothetical protein
MTEFWAIFLTVWSAAVAVIGINVLIVKYYVEDFLFPRLQLLRHQQSSPVMVTALVPPKEEQHVPPRKEITGAQLDKMIEDLRGVY